MQDGLTGHYLVVSVEPSKKDNLFMQIQKFYFTRHKNYVV